MISLEIVTLLCVILALSQSCSVCTVLISVFSTVCTMLTTSSLGVILMFERVFGDKSRVR
jgi:hypothetical protein